MIYVRAVKGEHTARRSSLLKPLSNSILEWTTLSSDNHTMPIDCINRRVIVRVGILKSYFNVSVQRISFLNNWFGCMNKPREETPEHTNLQLDSKRLWVWHSFSQTRGNPLHNSWHFQTKGRIILRGNISNATSKKSSVCLEQGGRVSGGRSVAGQYKMLYLLTPTMQVFTKISGTVLANCKKKVFCLHQVSRSIYQKK